MRGITWFVAAAIAVVSTESLAQTCTWSTVDTFTAPGAVTNGHTAIGARDERLYVAGTATIDQNNSRWIVRQGRPSGSWTTVDEYLPLGGTIAHADGMSIDQQGNVYVAGGTVGSTIVPWVVRKSSDRGVT